MVCPTPHRYIVLWTMVVLVLSVSASYKQNIGAMSASVTADRWYGVHDGIFCERLPRKGPKEARFDTFWGPAQGVSNVKFFAPAQYSCKFSPFSSFLSKPRMAKKQSKSGVDKTGCRRVINILPDWHPVLSTLFSLSFWGIRFWLSAVMLGRPAAEIALHDPPSSPTSGSPRS